MRRLADWPVVAVLLDLLLAGDCGVCHGPAGSFGVCASCWPLVDAEPQLTRPTPAPLGLPECFTAGQYSAGLRELILEYKERGRRELAVPLGYLLAQVVRFGLATWPARASRPVRTVVLVPVPATAAAIRARHGDHMLRLAVQVHRRLRAAGWPVALVQPLRARPRLDSAHLDSVARAEAAAGSFVARPAACQRLRGYQGGAVVLLDDLVTTGATLAAAAHQLAAVGVGVSFAATVAATARQIPSAGLWPGFTVPGDGPTPQLL